MLEFANIQYQDYGMVKFMIFNNLNLVDESQKDMI